MPGHGWLGMKKSVRTGRVDDYLSAIDAVAKENYVDKTRLGCVGASYVVFCFYLAGIHNNCFQNIYL
jgi:hypothetical protein